jgi:hypothetical protein
MPLSCDPADELAGLVDMLASEYGWSADTIIGMPIDQPPQLIHAILIRKGVQVFRKVPDGASDACLSDRIKSIFSQVDTLE